MLGSLEYPVGQVGDSSLNFYYCCILSFSMTDKYVGHGTSQQTYHSVETFGHIKDQHGVNMVSLLENLLFSYILFEVVFVVFVVSFSTFCFFCFCIFFSRSSLADNFFFTMISLMFLFLFLNILTILTASGWCSPRTVCNPTKTIFSLRNRIGTWASQSTSSTFFDARTTGYYSNSGATSWTGVPNFEVSFS